MTASREDVLKEAATWVGTKFHWMARLKRTAEDPGGVDCANFIAAVYEECGVFKAEDWGFFGPDWHLNTTEEHYIFRLLRHATKLPASGAGKPGDIVTSKCGLVHAQGGIVVEWPKIIFAHPRSGVRYGFADREPLWQGMEKLFFDPFAAPAVSTATPEAANV